jgi:hypothetical protein
MKSELVKALNSRKKQVLGLTLKIFNKVQDKHVTTFRIDELKTKKIDEIMRRCELILEDSRSPILSGLM